jgi:hypothetical protein
MGRGSALDKLSQNMNEELVTRRTKALDAVTGLQQLAPAIKMLQDPMFTGSMANWRTGMAKLANLAGYNKYDDQIANTEAYQAHMGTQVAQIIKQFGSGTGLSDADREYAEKIVGGKIDVNPKAIRRLVKIANKGYKNLIKNYNKDASQVMKKEGALEALPYSLMVDLPKEYDIPWNDEGAFNVDAPVPQAPPEALDYLRKNSGNAEIMKQFKAKYGYLPQ